MKKIVFSLLALMLVLCLLSASAFAATISDMVKSTEEEQQLLQELENGKDIEFSPTVTAMFDSDWLTSSEFRATLTYLLAYDLYNAGYPEVCDAVMNYDSYIGQYGEMYIVSGMYNNHAFMIFYFPAEHSAVYRVAEISMNNEKIESSLNGTMLTCTDYYLNNKKDIYSFADVLASSGK